MARFGLAVLGCAGVTTLAQEPAPSPKPRIELAAGGTVNAIVRDAEGGLIVGGRFTKALGEPRANLARLRPDGTLDPDFAPNISGGEVRAIALAPDGAIFIAGSFNRVGTAVRSMLAKFDAFRALDPQWNPRVIGEIRAIAVSDAGAVFVGGSYFEIDGFDRQGLAKLASQGVGAVDPTWDPAAPVTSLKVGPDGWVYVAGGFSRVGGEYRIGIARLSPDGAGRADPQWDAAVDGAVRGLDFAADGSIYVFGSFNEIGGVSRRGLAKLLPGTPVVAAPAWSPQIFQWVDAIHVGAAGSLHVAGRPATRGLPELRHRLVTLSADDAAVQPGSVPELNFGVCAIAEGTGDRRIVGGDFTIVGGQHRLGLVDLEATGVPGPALDVEAPGSVTAIEPDPAGGAYVSGNFWKADGLLRYGLLRVDADGVLDRDWKPRAALGITGFAGKNGLALDPASGKLYVATWFPDLGGDFTYRIGRVSASGDGTLDLGWRASIDDTVMAVETDEEGSVYAGGLFNFVNGVPRRHLVKLSAVHGNVDPEWNPSPNGFVNVLRVAGDSLYVGGEFNDAISPISIGGQTHTRFSKVSLSGRGDADAAWQFGLARSPYTITADGNGSLFVDGRHAILRIATASPGAVSARWASVPANGMIYVNALAVNDAWLYASGKLTLESDEIGELRRYPLAVSDAWDTRWNPAPTGSVTAMAVDGRGTLFVGGSFDQIGGQRRTLLAAFSERIFEDGFDPPP